MKTYYKHFAVQVLSIVLLSACTSPADNEDVNIQAEKANVEKVIKAYKAGIEALSVEGLTGLFMADSEIFESGGEEGSFTHYLDHHLAPELEVFESFSFNDHKIKVKIDMPYAFTTETYTYKIVLKSDGKLIERKGVATSILKKENDQWKIMKTHTSARAMNSSH